MYCTCIIFNITWCLIITVDLLGRIECLEMLFKAGAEINCKDKKVWMPVSEIYMYIFTSLIQLNPTNSKSVFLNSLLFLTQKFLLPGDSFQSHLLQLYQLHVFQTPAISNFLLSLSEFEIHVVEFNCIHEAIIVGHCTLLVLVY